MKLRYEYLTLGQLGEVFGTTSHKVGRWLVQIGLRYESKQGLKPSRDAYGGGFVKDVPSRNQGYCYAWHAEKSIKALVEAGHKVSIQPGHELLAPCRLNGPFRYRPNAQIGHEIVNADGSVAVCVTGEDNARFLTRLLNLADKYGVVQKAIRSEENSRDETQVIPAATGGKVG